MSLAKRKRLPASQSTVDATAVPKPPPTAPMPPVETPEPLGAHGSEGNREAREAFVRDEGNGATIPQPQSDTSQSTPQGEESQTESIPQMSIEQIAQMTTAVIDFTGSFVGNKVLKRPDIEWELAPKQTDTVEKALVPVLSDMLADTKVTPMTLFIGVLVGCYGPKVGMMMMTIRPGSEEEKPKEVPPQPAPQPIVHEAVVSPPPDQVKAEQETVSNGVKKSFGWS